MSPDDALHEALANLETPEIDVDRALGQVHRKARRARVLRFGGPIAAVLLVVTVSVAVVANRSGGGGLAAVHVVSAAVPRDPSTPAQSDAGAAAVNAFSIDLFKQVAGHQQGNLVLSPYSVDEVLSMALAGARGSTYDQIVKVLHAGANEADYHQALNALDRQLAAPRTGEPGSSDPEHPGTTLPATPPVALHVADSVWVQRGFAVERAFLDRLARSYGAGVHTVDFARQAEASRRAINAWVKDHTRGRIPNLLAKGQVDDLTRLVLVNAVTFSGRWQTPFGEPTPGTFTTGSGKRVTAPMMESQTETADGASGPGWRSASIPYVGGAHLLVILPDHLDAYLESLTPQKFDAAAATSQSTAVAAVTMPTFETTSRLELNGDLQSLGMPDAFAPRRADFSGIDGKRDLHVSHVAHQAHIKVDQYGTEAEAATAAVFMLTSASVGPTPLVLDRPFLYAIVDDASGAILFLGRVDDPTATS